MAPLNEPLPWEIDASKPLVPVFCEGDCVGYCEPEYANEILEVMNEQEKLLKALRMACGDLVRKRKGDPEEVEELVQKYIQRAERPKSGPRAIALLLAERQKQLGVSPQEFLKFCDTYRVSSQDIKNMCAGREVPTDLIAPLARILGTTVEQVQDILDGIV
ncbi:hypothetical protein [Baaleninema simplex]|uniref:hypothetical protein n=1 Tax=Baaleninema simplex TaxID=2862350 RepID=UPI00034CA66A|nr:hypothetical protein [Baaleninema simplex]